MDRSNNVVGIINASGTADWYSYVRSKREAGSEEQEAWAGPGRPKDNPWRFASPYREVVNGKSCIAGQPVV